MTLADPACQARLEAFDLAIMQAADSILIEDGGKALVMMDIAAHFARCVGLTLPQMHELLDAVHANRHNLAYAALRSLKNS